ncbi:gustatory receptor 23a-like [Calliphora vicina]|uniref:gustatory receptor 23a-like n=1 Tax=Calliphora vicina TaxID=7373 RepID=UPI00325ADE58
MDRNLLRLLNICSVFGICIQIPQCCGRKGSCLFTLYIILLFAILILSCVLGVMKRQMEKEYIISWAVSTIVFISQMFTHFIILCETLSKQQQHLDFLRALDEIDDCFKIHLKMDVKTSNIIKQFRSTILIMNVISTTGLIVFALNFYLYSDAGYYWWALMSILAMRFRLLQFIVYVEILKCYMMGLNRKLNQVVCLKTQRCQQLLDIDYKHLQSLDVIKNIKHIYACIYEASTLMNEFGQASLFAASAANFLDFTCHIYWTLLAMDNLLAVYNIISSLATMVPLGMFMVKFCLICQAIKEEGQRTSLLLSRLVCSGACPSINTQYKNLLHDFTLQLMHQRIVFTGKRFFDYDLHYIFAICALIATHLIILIQFTKIDSNHYTNITT